jgi:hypothetical protein
MGDLVKAVERLARRKDEDIGQPPVPKPTSERENA